ncbi:MAG TPA: AMP-binding protein, partial [Rhizomicrobium sp.]
MNDGTMQDFPLTLDKILDHAAKWHSDVEIVTARDDGASDRINYEQLKSRALKTSHVLRELGVTLGQRVATLAWNTQAHVEAWYAIMGMGAVCHTLNPRLTATQLAAMVNQSEARIIIVSADLLPLARQTAKEADGVERILVIDGDTLGSGDGVSALAPLTERAAESVKWGEFDERAPCGLCFTSGSTGVPKGVSYTHRSNFLHTLRLLQADVLALTSA